ncbi:MAG: hypothetical protein QM621_01475 [Aeromicrobium sp.]|uniref:hypothetical protein n=1 Tax=Aeromicrobium sp. TaxID=1871063 RepID=UPI0039E55DB0
MRLRPALSRLALTAATGLLVATAACAAPEETPEPTEDVATGIDPAPLCGDLDLGAAFDVLGSVAASNPGNSIGATNGKGCEWTTGDGHVGIKAVVKTAEHPAETPEDVLAFAQAEWLDAKGSVEPFPEADYRPGEPAGWSYSISAPHPLTVAIGRVTWSTYVTADASLRCEYWGFADTAVAAAACDAIRTAVTA